MLPLPVSIPITTYSPSTFSVTSINFKAPERPWSSNSHHCTLSLSSASFLVIYLNLVLGFRINPNLHLSITDKSDSNMAQPLSRSPTPPFFNMRSATPIHNHIAHRMNQASGNVTAEAPVDRHSRYWAPDLYINHSPSASLQGSSQIPEPDNSAAKSSTTTHSSTASITYDGMKEQARLLEGLQRMKNRIRKAKGPDAARAATSFIVAPFGANVESSTHADWTFTEENYHKLLKTLHTRNEDIAGCRHTIKWYSRLADNMDDEIRDLEAHIERYRFCRRISRVWRRIFGRASRINVMDAGQTNIA